MVTERSQVRTAHLAANLTPYNQGYLDRVQANTNALIALGHSKADASAKAVGAVYTALRTQASVLAYSDVFLFCAILAFGVIPLTFLFSNIKASKGGAPAAH
jgi:DHA2 family multidrug resistance protein